MTLNFNKPLLNLSGEPIGSITIGQKLADLLMIENRGDSVKLLSWALALWKGEPITVDISDLDTLKELIKSTELANNLVKGRISEAIRQSIEKN